ncbi:MAG: DUF6781 family protein [Rhizobacter sp.]
MIKSGIDQKAMADMFTNATAKQGEALRKAVSAATLKALQGREMTVKNIQGVLKSVTQAASAGAANSSLPAVDVEAMLGKALAGMDAALLKAVDAQRTALEQFVEQGVGAQEKHLKGALANLEKMEDMFFDTVTKAAQSTGDQLQGPWSQVLEGMQLKGSASGTQATATVEQLMAAAQQASREGRAAGAKAAEALMKGYATLVSGVLIGMSEALRQEQSAAPAKAAAKGSRK